MRKKCARVTVPSVWFATGVVQCKGFRFGLYCEMMIRLIFLSVCVDRTSRTFERSWVKIRRAKVNFCLSCWNVLGVINVEGINEYFLNGC